MTIDFTKDQNGLVPAIIQDAQTSKVLMLGYMDKEAYQKTMDTRKVTFYSRSRKRLWTKGEESGNELHLVDLKVDCDQDTLLVRVQPKGPVCHTGADTCWGEENKQETSFLTQLEQVIARRKKDPENKESYVASLFRGGINKIAQKVGEEAVEMVIESKDDDEELFLNESADLLFHYLILLQARGFTLRDVTKVLEARR